jgi:hypothetical protein
MKFFVRTLLCLVAAGVFAHGQLAKEINQSGQPTSADLTCSPAPCRLPNMKVTSGIKVTETAPNLAINPQNSSQMVLGETDTSCASWGAAYHTGDGGMTWTKTCLPTVGIIDQIASAWMVYDSKGEVHALLGTTNLDCGEDILLETHSSNNGATWSSLNQFSSVLFQVLDSQAMDNFAGSPFQGNIYASATEFLFNTVQIEVWQSADGGGSWTSKVAATLPNTSFFDGEGYSHLEVGKDGRVYLAYMASTNGGLVANEMMFTKSSDAGKTWTSPVMVNSATPISALPNTTIYVADAPILAVDNSLAGKSRLYMTFYNWTGAFMQVLITHSDDGGMTWSTPVPVTPASATNDQFKPRVSLSASGSVGVTWLDRRDDPYNINYRTYAAISRNGIFTKDVALATASSAPLFGLSYNDSPAANVWSGSTLFAAWPDSRKGPLQQAIGGYRQH